MENAVSRAIADLRAGRFVLVYDGEGREEGAGLAVAGGGWGGGGGGRAGGAARRSLPRHETSSGSPTWRRSSRPPRRPTRSCGTSSRRPFRTTGGLRSASP